LVDVANRFVKGTTLAKNIENALDEDFKVTILDGRPPSRKVVTRSPHRSVGLIACSWIQEQCIEYESQLERRFVQRSLVFPGVQRILHQPFSIPYVEEGKELSYTPDFFLLFRDGTKVVVEVKPEIFFAKHLDKLMKAEQFLKKKDVPFLVVPDTKIDSDCSAENAELLLRYTRGAIADDCLSKCIGVLQTSGVPLAVDLLMQMADTSFGSILHLAARGHLSIPLSKRIDDQTLVSIPKKENKNDYVRFCGWFDIAPR
jgi:hypothetical protein